MNIGEVLEKTVRFIVDYNGNSIWIDALESSLTPAFLDACNNVTTNPREFARELANVLKAWDLDWNGEPYPPTFENVARLPISFLDAVAAKIAESWSGNAQTPRP